MKSNLLNLCLPVRLAIELLGGSTVKAVHAINAQRGEATFVSETAKAGTPKTKKQKGMGPDAEKLYAISESVSMKYEGELNIVRKLDVFNAAVEKLHSAFPFPGAMPLPVEISDWITLKCVAKPEVPAPAVSKPAKSKPAPVVPEVPAESVAS